MIGAHWIGGEPVTEGGAPFQAEDPATGAVLEPVYREGGAVLVDRAAAAAAAAAPALSRTTGAARAEFLEAVAAEIEELGEPLLVRAMAETGLPMARLEMERGRTCGQLRLFAAVAREGSWGDARIDRPDPQRQPLPKPDVRRMLRPLGPVAVFGASNFPLAFSVAGGDTASAWAAGCPVVVKGHPAHPGTSELVGGAIAKAAARTGMPAGVFGLVHGKEEGTGAALVEHPLIRAVGFTGSLAGGRALADRAAARPEPIPVCAEMGSTNPVFLLPEALAAGAEDLGRALAVSVTLGVGQFCTNPGLVFGLKGPPLDRFTATLAEAVGAFTGTMLHRGLCAAYRAGVERLRGSSGVEELTGSQQPPGATQGPGAVFRTDAATFAAAPVLRQEVFGPCTLVVVCGDRQQLLATARHLPGQLTATVHGSSADLDENPGLVEALEGIAGRVLFGGMPTGVEVSAAMHHGGPYPATSDSRTTSVGTAAITRFARPVCWQDAPEQVLPWELRDGNPLGIRRLIDGAWDGE